MRSHSPIRQARSHPHPSPNTIALSNPTNPIAPTSIPKHDRTLQFHKHDRTLQSHKPDRTHIHPQTRSHSPIEQALQHPHPSPKTIALSNSTSTIALSNPTSTIAPASIAKGDRTLQLNKYDRTHIPPQTRSHSYPNEGDHTLLPRLIGRD
ncbi:hypothetical protein [Argonema antarcticum]|uniref:hypothetical protein n=1 Tax=Argonema antarcticum TaxID=2942763 RepID=UPI002013635D|nr:hypothetical protein [Argonema antarcticum]MCL1473812.1 hypothetical protein [Argonema antarcticum A004/B2]